VQGLAVNPDNEQAGNFYRRIHLADGVVAETVGVQFLGGSRTLREPESLTDALEESSVQLPSGDVSDSKRAEETPDHAAEDPDGEVGFHAGGAQRTKESHLKQGENPTEDEVERAETEGGDRPSVEQRAETLPFHFRGDFDLMGQITRRGGNSTRIEERGYAGDRREDDEADPLDIRGEAGDGENEGEVAKEDDDGDGDQGTREIEQRPSP
jgi:hypothetical protein